jgi:hypothetical protein
MTVNFRVRFVRVAAEHKARSRCAAQPEIAADDHLGRFAPSLLAAEFQGDIQILVLLGGDSCHDGAVRSGTPQLANHVGVEQEHGSAQRNRRPAAAFTTRRNRALRAGCGRQEQMLEGGAGYLLQTFPVIHRDQHGRVDSSLGHNLKSFLQGGFQEFTEASLGVLQPPFLGHPQD